MLDYTYKIDVERKIITQTFTGRFPLLEIPNYESQVVGDAAYSLDFNRLYNFCDCENLQVTTTELMTVVGLANNWFFGRETKIALVAGSQQDSGILRIFAASVDQLVMKVFLSVREALLWLTNDGNYFGDGISKVVHRTINMQGDFIFDDVLEAQIELSNGDVAEADLPLLWDLRNAFLKESLDSLTEMSVYIAANHDRDRAGVRSAILVDSHLMEMMYKKMMTVDNWPHEESKIFRSYREAVAWLGGAED